MNDDAKKIIAEWNAADDYCKSDPQYIVGRDEIEVLIAHIEKLEAEVGGLSKRLRQAEDGFIKLSEPVAVRNGGELCDNPFGPCACGAWHNPDEFADRVLRLTEAKNARLQAIMDKQKRLLNLFVVGIQNDPMASAFFDNRLLAEAAEATKACRNEGQSETGEMT